MHIVFNSLSNVRYEKGIISFEVFLDQYKSERHVVVIPYEDFVFLIDYLKSESVKIDFIHRNWKISSVSSKLESVKEESGNENSSDSGNNLLGPVIAEF